MLNQGVLMSDEEQLTDEYEGMEESAKEQKKPEIAREPLLVSLLRDVVARLWAGDTVMQEFVNHVIAPLSAQLGHEAAKGGEFAQRHISEGRQGVERYAADQSMRAHLLNGLLPILHVARSLQKWG